ncbi:MAG: hypothetical protein AAFN77_23110 [Planctomycetota bacterium]
MPDKLTGHPIDCPKCKFRFIFGQSIADAADSMTRLIVSCRNCFKKLKIPPRYLEQKRRCPKCQTATILRESKTECRVACSECDRTFRIPGDMVGNAHNCPKCLAMILLTEVKGKQTVTCDECQDAFGVPAKLLGRTGRCPHCVSKTRFIAVADQVNRGRSVVDQPDVFDDSSIPYIGDDES